MTRAAVLREAAEIVHEMILHVRVVMPEDPALAARLESFGKSCLHMAVADLLREAMKDEEP